MSFRAIAGGQRTPRSTKELAYARMFCLLKIRTAFTYNGEEKHADIDAFIKCLYQKNMVFGSGFPYKPGQFYSIYLSGGYRPP